MSIWYRSPHITFTYAGSSNILWYSDEFVMLERSKSEIEKLNQIYTCQCQDTSNLKNKHLSERESWDSGGSIKYPSLSNGSWTKSLGMWWWLMDLCSTLGLLLLHMYMYGWNVYAWQQTRINYGFIFEFSPGTELRYREVLLICTALSSMLLGTMIVHIITSAKEAPNYNHSEWAPMAITLVSSCFLSRVFQAPMMILLWSLANLEQRSWMWYGGESAEIERTMLTNSLVHTWTSTYGFRFSWWCFSFLPTYSTSHLATSFCDAFAGLYLPHSTRYIADREINMQHK
jgi:hypothetical protein